MPRLATVTLDPASDLEAAKTPLKAAKPAVPGATERLASGPVDTRVSIDSREVAEKYSDILNRYNFRMAITPAMRKRLLAVIRIQDAKAQEVEFDSIGFDARSADILRHWASKPAGLVLVTGPTGSGKTTSLYSMLQMIDPLAKQVASVENPVEAEFGMWAQQERDEAAGLVAEGAGAEASAGRTMR
jgi:Tfp pilus assembly ATPase PilU